VNAGGGEFPDGAVAGPANHWKPGDPACLMAGFRRPMPEPAPARIASNADKQRRFDSILVFIFTIGIALATMRQRAGYPLADAVEYLKNAARVESGQPMIADSLRPFFFSAFLAPIFRLTRVFGSSDGREVVAIATVLMLAISGLAAVATYRLISKIAGAPAALGAALFLAANRIFQFWAPTISTDVPCALGIATAGALALRSPTFANSVAIGGAIAFAILFKYQAMMPAGLILLCLPVLWRASGWKKNLYYVSGTAAGVAAGAIAQSTLDWVGGRGFGATLHRYLANNIIYPYAVRLGPILQKLFGREAVDAWLQQQLGLTPQLDRWASAGVAEKAQRVAQPYDWYWTELPRFLTWFEFLLFVVGVAVLLWRRPRGWWMPMVVLGGSVAALTVKATKEWRLFICIIPFVFCFVGAGFQAMIEFIDRRAPRLAPVAAVLCLAPNLVTMLGGVPLQTNLARLPAVRPFLAYDARTPVAMADGHPVLKGWRPWQIVPICMNPADFGGYERAARWINENAPAGSRVSATWFWQFHFRLRPDLYLVEPLYQADEDYLKLPPEKREEVRQYIKSLDFYATHLQALVVVPEIFELVEREFELVTSFENLMFDETLNRILLFKRKAKPSNEAWCVQEFAQAEARRLEAQCPPNRRLVYALGPGRGENPAIELLDAEFDAAELAAGRITLKTTFRVPEGSVANGGDLILHFRVRNSRREVADEAGYRFAYGRVSGDRFKPGTIVVQRIPVRPARDLYDFLKVKKNGEAIALDAWLQVVQARDGKLIYPLPVVERFERPRDPDSNFVKICGIDYLPE
jgi:4-amino-4-deoxy-L-arabinose transferase-like glycosyltransferase